MSSRNLLNLALLTLVLVLVLIVIFEPGKQEPIAVTRLTAIKPQDIHTIHITRASLEDIQLQKEQGTWYMRKPYALPANDFRVQSLLRLLQTESHSQHNLSQLDPAKFGFAPARATVTFNDDVVIQFGDNEPLQQRRYITVDQSLHLITDTFYYQAASKAANFASHALLPPGNISKLVLPNLTMTLKEGKWRIQPEQATISADAITEFISNWRHTQAIELRPYRDKKVAPTIRITFKDSDKTIMFSMIKQDDELSLVRHDIQMQYILNEDSAGKLLNLPESEPESETDPLAQQPTDHPTTN